MRIKVRVTIFLTLMTILVIITGQNAVHVTAEEPVKWSPPINISDTPTGSLDPAIVTDKYGYAHVFWIEDFEGTKIGKNYQGIPTGNTIYYRRWDGASWTEPIDLFVTSTTYSYPTPAVDDAGRLYLIWAAFEGVYFSSAPANAATSAMAWTPKFILTSTYGLKPAIFAHGDGIIDIIYSANQESGSKNGNIYHIRSVDRGKTWTAPAQISEVYPNTGTLAVFPRIAIDGQERLHVAWYETDPPDYLGTAAFYARSVDNGETWSIPLKVVESNPDEIWASAIQVATIGDNEVHLTWVCGRLPHRCHQWSTNGGETWTPPHHVFGELHSLAIWDAITSDSGGKLYWIMQLRYPEALYYSYWTGDHWIDPPLVVDAAVIPAGHGPQIAINHGNQLDLVVQHQTKWDIWFAQGITSLSTATTPIPPPTVLSTSEATLTPTTTPTVTPITATPVIKNATITDPSPDTTDQGSGISVLAGAISATIVIGAVILYKILAKNL